jgi:hypothetical protein
MSIYQTMLDYTPHPMLTTYSVSFWIKFTPSATFSFNFFRFKPIWHSIAVDNLLLNFNSTNNNLVIVERLASSTTRTDTQIASIPLLVDSINYVVVTRLTTSFTVFMNGISYTYTGRPRVPNIPFNGYASGHLPPIAISPVKFDVYSIKVFNKPLLPIERDIEYRSMSSRFT